MIYTTGTIAGNGSTITGTGTNFTAAGSLIRVGCTLIAFTNPVQVLQLTAVTSGNTLSVTHAVSPAIAAGTRFAILLSDSLSVDGLAQDIAETFGMYQKYMGGFSDVMNGTGDVTITINGKAVTVPGQKSLAKKSDLGTASAKDAGTAAGNVMMVGAFGIGDSGNAYPMSQVTQFLVYGSTPNNGETPDSALGCGVQVAYAPTRRAQYFIQSSGKFFSRFSQTAGILDASTAWNLHYTSQNTTKSSDGTLKAASPIIKIFAAGDSETNDESEGATVKRLAVGEYLIAGCMGLNADAAWGGIDGGFDIPTDRNKQPLIWLDYEVNPDGSVLVKTYHRTYPDAPEFARNEREGFAGGDPIDIPADQFVSVRVEMPQNSI